MKLINVLWSLFKDSFDLITHGRTRYKIWMASLTALMLIGTYAYYFQIEHGLSVTGMTDGVVWGLYISNFTFFVGIAAAAVMLVLPTYILHDYDFAKAVIIGEGMAIAALIMSMTFVVVDMGGPANLWHMIPFIGNLNFPESMLSWDMIALLGYLMINISIPAYILTCKYQGKEPKKSVYIPGVFLSVFWAVGIHLVTAFLYQGLMARPFWNNALLGPRFLISAFTAGPALMIIALGIIRKVTDYHIKDVTLVKISLLVTGMAAINMIMLVSELFKEFYFVTHHSISAQYLFFGLGEYNALVPWIWTGISMNIIATLILITKKLHNRLLYPACALLFVGIWIEKGFGLIVPGFIPGQYGKIVEYSPSIIEIAITIAVWALGAFVFTLLTRVAIHIELGKLRYKPSHLEKEVE
ncbi:sulfate reduction electron transfer complex DsrMKJOP subunit DsrP [Aureispira anguillae]|uniref:Polysulfide reductase NrfD n=1 Tax=Aureispira anguillae TaxID=2864201 RepID=A0A916DVU9_9BACT|nr:NrfD/PsrC family molybdoenzyme membrane anchor subunit [Aureispira anguillae]BDS14766.1 polysulfide reductase NrfD [Aureispira anguillae]